MKFFNRNKDKDYDKDSVEINPILPIKRFFRFSMAMDILKIFMLFVVIGFVAYQFSAQNLETANDRDRVSHELEEHRAREERQAAALNSSVAQILDGVDMALQNQAKQIDLLALQIERGNIGRNQTQDSVELVLNNLTASLDEHKGQLADLQEMLKDQPYLY